MRTITMIALALMLSASVKAQDNLATGHIFSNISSICSQNDQVHMTGKSVEQYGLTLFRSVLAKESPSAVGKMRNAALEDGKMAVNQKTIVRDGETVACYYQLPPSGESGDNRFVLFRQMDEKSAMLIYMEGETTLDKIVNIKLNKK